MLHAFNGITDYGADKSHAHHAQNYHFRQRQATAHGDQVAQTLVCREQFRAHQVDPAADQGDLQGPKNHGQGRRDAELEKNLPVAGAISACHLDKGRVGHPDADKGVDDAGYDPSQKDNEDLAFDADAKPENG